VKIIQLRNLATDNTNFNKLDDYIAFCRHYLDFVSDTKNLQAKIIAQNENQYFFMQYNKDGNYQITRPINSELFLDHEVFDTNLEQF